jgi:hypothetical protein
VGGWEKFRKQKKKKLGGGRGEKKAEIRAEKWLRKGKQKK